MKWKSVHVFFINLEKKVKILDEQQFQGIHNYYSAQSILLFWLKQTRDIKRIKAEQLKEIEKVAIIMGHSVLSRRVLRKWKLCLIERQERVRDEKEKQELWGKVRVWLDEE